MCAHKHTYTCTHTHMHTHTHTHTLSLTHTHTLSLSHALSHDSVSLYTEKCTPSFFFYLQLQLKINDQATHCMSSIASAILTSGVAVVSFSSFSSDSPCTANMHMCIHRHTLLHVHASVCVQLLISAEHRNQPSNGLSLRS